MKKNVSRIILYLVGLFIITIGINLSIISALGVSPVSAFTYPLSQATGLSLGLITVLTYSVLVLIQWLLLQKQFKAKDLLQIPFSMCFGLFVDMTGRILAFIHPENYLQQFLIMMLGVIVCALGATIYIAMDIVPNAPEGFNLAVSKRFSMPFSRSKVLSDCLFIAVGVVISLLSQGKVTAIREGTLVSALLTGIIIGKFQKILNEPLKRVAFEEKNICEGELVNE
ncbi:YczE/YyaS/YitT family protein [Lachnospira pectinoschiza]|uniref:Uncharacterized membrane protein YczE n=1 Tax=Lachnospira pectinoschiza TaxID=28052 RepID=A0A1H0A290_9FIRM|nr:DUF6198 family protein [Lachnospira pectinoschiza]SDN27414.1 Uncharacterized membrane protein YczE [Lachnospira pectinoschiza]